PGPGYAPGASQRRPFGSPARPRRGRLGNSNIGPGRSYVKGNNVLAWFDFYRTTETSDHTGRWSLAPLLSAGTPARLGAASRSPRAKIWSQDEKWMVGPTSRVTHSKPE